MSNRTEPRGEGTAGAAREPRRSFRRRDAIHNWTLHFGPNMTPMVDVVMVILVFFMASAAFLGPEWYLKSLVPRKPPEGAGLTSAGTDKPIEKPPVRLEVALDVDDSGRTVATGVGKVNATVAEMGEALAAEATKAAKAAGPAASTAPAPRAGAPASQEAATLEVLIRPTARVPYRDVVRLHEAAQRAGIQRVGVGMSAERRDQPGG